ncbi:hypothetical protein IEU95_10205 [Hoyosella rhizosphaerae]|uniref:Secreted protein n=1 Tax=Hoyosella rhizosphaerae TaxID=1755582 RepID=A0A916U0H9_9ACTN|nr:hypothetical protein [Hoyosella rhizosphaerae]MBN4927207.1 hypothetical protein [Hoyosella rhizosphaerae]GGC53152.1 hypothetical protein GCM10011410_01870 [Hoyosella rhizosphaerae]
MSIRRFGVVVAASALFYGASFGVASAGHNGADVEFVASGDCGETTFTAGVIDAAGTHKVNNMVLVVHADGETQNQVIPVDGTTTSITVGPFTSPSAGTETIHWRVFGGGERDYDDPSWNGYGEAGFTDDINAYAEDNGWGWVVAGPDDDNPFTIWSTVDVESCAGGAEECAGMPIDLGSIQFCLPAF